jgi:hypothetical protein
MQRVLSEMLRRSCDPTERATKKRTADIDTDEPSSDDRYAEQLYDRETRGARPGYMAWERKRKRTEEWDTLNVKRMHMTVA